MAKMLAAVSRILARLLRRILRNWPEVLVRALDAGLCDPHATDERVTSAPFRRFDSVRPFDVHNWARRKGVDLPKRTASDAASDEGIRRG